MTRAYVEAPATHYRLAPETWALIAEEYKNGASAKDIGAKWKVAPSSVYRHACVDGFTKKGMGDARARAHARMVEEEEASARGLHPVGSRALKGLFQPPPANNEGAGDPAELAQSATLASGRAMRGRLWAEAKALAGLAESYSRLAEKSPRGSGGTIETASLELLFDVISNTDHRVDRRFAVNPDAKDDPDLPIKTAYWEHQGEAYARMRLRETENIWRAIAAEKLLREMGVEVPTLKQSMVDAAADSGKWARLEDDDIREFIRVRATTGQASPDDPR